MQITLLPREVVKYATGVFMESPDSLVFFCIAGDIRYILSPATESVVKYSHLRPTQDSLKRVGGVLVYCD